MSTLALTWYRLSLHRVHAFSDVTLQDKRAAVTNCLCYTGWMLTSSDCQPGDNLQAMIRSADFSYQRHQSLDIQEACLVYCVQCDVMFRSRRHVLTDGRWPSADWQHACWSPRCLFVASKSVAGQGSLTDAWLDRPCQWPSAADQTEMWRGCGNRRTETESKYAWRSALR